MRSARGVARADQPRRVAASLRKVGGSLQPQVFIQHPAQQGLVGLPWRPGHVRVPPPPRAPRRWPRPVGPESSAAGRAGTSMQINAVEQRHQAHLVARHLGRGAAANCAGCCPQSRRAGVHGGNELKARRKFGRCAARAMVMWPAFQRLAQRFQALRANSGKFVQKQHAFVRQCEISPGRGGEPPPTSATALQLWCGCTVGAASIAPGEAPRQAAHGGTL